MPNFKKPKSLREKEPVVLQATKRQLVLAMCAFFVALLVVFLLGVLVGLYENENRQRQGTAAGEGALETGEGSTETAQAPIPEETVPTPPPRSLDTVETKKPYREVSVPTEDTGPSPQEPADEQTESPAVAATVAATAEATVEADKDAEETSTGEQKEPPVVAEAEPPDAVAPPTEPDVMTPTTPPALVLEPEDEAVSPPPPPTSSTETTVPAYAIQLAYLGDPKRAEALRQKADAKTDRVVRILPVGDGEHFRVLVGDFADAGAAEKALEEVRRATGSRDCFVWRATAADRKAN